MTSMDKEIDLVISSAVRHFSTFEQQRKVIKQLTAKELEVRFFELSIT